MPDAPPTTPTPDPNEAPIADEASSRRVSLIRLLHALAWILIACGVVGSLLGFMGRLWWALDLASHFRLQYLLVLLAGALLALTAHRTMLFGVGLGFAILNAALVFPGFVPQAAPEGGDRLRLLFVNVHTSNQHTERIAQLIREQDPDVIGLMEINRRWTRALAPTLARYRHRLVKPRPDNFGIGLYSRRPWRNAKIVWYGPANVPSIRARLRLPRSEVTLLFTHPTPPVSRLYARWRRRQMEAIVAHRDELPRPLVLFGDLNASPWSVDFRWLVRSLGLEDSRRGFGVQRTWPAGSWLLRIPIDHCLVSPGVVTRARRLGPNVGSDHLPVIVDLVVPTR